jgi:AcrR family transcriptional regulator
VLVDTAVATHWSMVAGDTVVAHAARTNEDPSPETLTFTGFSSVGKRHVGRPPDRDPLPPELGARAPSTRCAVARLAEFPATGYLTIGDAFVSSRASSAESRAYGLEVSEPMTIEQATTASGHDTSTRRRILAATNEVLARNGQTKLSLSEVAAQAGVSRPTLYRWFASKEELLHAFGLYEREMFDSGMSKATAGLRGNEKLDSALRFIVSYQLSYSGVRLIDIEPEVVIKQLTQVIPVMRTRLERLLQGSNRSVKAATAIRVAVSHYIVRSDDTDQFLAQLRHAVGIKSGTDRD